MQIGACFWRVDMLYLLRPCVADGIRRGDEQVVDELVAVLQKLMK